VAVCFFGEGALGQGILYEEMNLAQLWKLPVIFVCENNSYNEYTHFKESTAGDVAARAEAFGIATHTIDGQDVRLVHQVASTYIERARKGEGPAFLQCITYRYHGHHVGDIARAYYRPKAEEQEWVTQKDPVTLHGQWLMDNGMAERATLDAIQEKLVKEMDAAVEFAVNAPYPDPSRVTEDVYAS
jgi:acetoin:2,6-dichlorophenolindophenol oxidoreductase subunit alpha